MFQRECLFQTHSLLKSSLFLEDFDFLHMNLGTNPWVYMVSQELGSKRLSQLTFLKLYGRVLRWLIKGKNLGIYVTDDITIDMRPFTKTEDKIMRVYIQSRQYHTIIISYHCEESGS